MCASSGCLTLQSLLHSATLFGRQTAKDWLLKRAPVFLQYMNKLNFKIGKTSTSRKTHVMHSKGKVCVILTK